MARPIASTSTTGLSASDRTRSRSWIIRSSTILTSVDRNVYVPARHGFDVLRVSQVREHGVPGGIESFDMTDLQHEAVAAGQRDQAIGLGDGTGDRLFDQHVHAVAEQLFGDFVMVGGGGGDDGRVDAACAARRDRDRRRCRIRRPRARGRPAAGRRLRPVPRRRATGADGRGCFPDDHIPRRPHAVGSRRFPPVTAAAVTPFGLGLQFARANGSPPAAADRWRAGFRARDPSPPGLGTAGDALRPGREYRRPRSRSV